MVDYKNCYLVQEKNEFYGTQVGRSVAEGVSNVTVFHERTPSDTWLDGPAFWVWSLCDLVWEMFQYFFAKIDEDWDGYWVNPFMYICTVCITCFSYASFEC